MGCSSQNSLESMRRSRIGQGEKNKQGCEFRQCLASACWTGRSGVEITPQSSLRLQAGELNAFPFMSCQPLAKGHTCRLGNLDTSELSGLLGRGAPETWHAECWKQGQPKAREQVCRNVKGSEKNCRGHPCVHSFTQTTSKH